MMLATRRASIIPLTKYTYIHTYILMFSALPATLRRSHRTLLAGLRALAYELHVLHRLWYKGRAQFRHMVWWRPLQRVRRIGSAAVTGPLAGSVPLARAAAPPQPTDALVETDGTRVVGADVLWAIADVHASLWGAEAPSCAHLEKRGAPPTCAPAPGRASGSWAPRSRRRTTSLSTTTCWT